MESKVFLFIHLPKTGGVSLYGYLSRYWQPALTFKGSYTALPAFAGQVWQQRHTVRLLGGHIPFGMHALFPRPFLYLSLLREPVDRCISLFYFYKTREDTPLHQQVQHMTLAEFMRSGTTPLSDNGMVRQLSGDVWRPYSKCTPAMLEKAKANLRRYVFFGLQAHFDDYLDMLAQVTGLERQQYLYRNKTKARPQREEIDAETEAVIAQYNVLDQALYDYALRLYEEIIKDPAAYVERLKTSASSLERMGTAAQAFFFWGRNQRPHQLILRK